MTVVTIRKSFCPDVSFEAYLHDKTEEGRIGQALGYWTNITGLNWKSMPYKVSHEDGYLFVRIESPIDNQSHTVIYWEI